MVRRLVVLVLGVGLPTALLGGGWLWASMRERGGLEREQVMLVARSAEAVRGAVDESLEELRRREDGRPFFLYNHYYSPPDVLSITDPVAVSPLAKASDDLRVAGYFQVDPDGTIRTPHDEPTGEPSALGTRVAARVRSATFAPLRALAYIDPDAAAHDTMLAQAPVPPTARTRTRVVTRFVREPVAGDEPSNDTSAGPRPGAALANAGTNADPYTVGLNAYGNQLYEDITQAQAGSAASYQRVTSRGRQVLPMERNTVSWEHQIATQQAYVARQSSNVAGSEPTRPPAVASPRQPQSTPVPAPAQAPRARTRAVRVVVTEAVPEIEPPTPPRPELAPASAVARQEEAEQVSYTPMVFRPLDGAFVLTRVVSHRGAAAVQGVLLDERQLLRVWLPAVVERHSVAGAMPTVVSSRAVGQCWFAKPASHVVGGVWLCFPRASAAAALTAFDERLHLQLGLLLALVLAIVIAIVVIARAGRRADELSRQKTAFVSAVSHELRTPLTTIRMNAEMLRDGMVSEAKQGRFLDDVVRESVRLSRLVDNVLEMSRLEEGRRPMQKSPAELGGFLQGVVADQSRFVEGKGFSLELHVPPEPIEVSFDALALEQVVVNLIDNAVKYTADASDKTVTVTLEPSADRATVHVLDRGPGIPPGEIERAFERFHRVERKGRSHVVGTGLGLALVRQLARAHGGDASAHARPGGGLDVVVWLPRT